MTTATAIAEHPLTPKQYEQRRRDFYEATQPLIRAMCQIQEAQPFRYTIQADQMPVHEILWQPGAREAYDRCQSLIDWWAERIMGGER